MYVLERTPSSMKATPHRIHISTPAASRIALVFAGVTVVLTILRALAFHLNFDPALGYFLSPLVSSLLYIVPVILCIAGTALAYLRSPSIPRNKKKKLTPEEKREKKKVAKQEKDRIAALKRAGVKLPPERFPTLTPPLRRERTAITRLADLLCAGAFLGATIIDATLLFPLPRLRVIFAAISVAAFLLPLSGHKLSPLSRAAHLAPCAYCIVCIAVDYFDWNAPMNGPAKIGTQLTLCALMLSRHTARAIRIAPATVQIICAIYPLNITSKIPTTRHSPATTPFFDKRSIIKFFKVYLLPPETI